MEKRMKHHYVILGKEPVQIVVEMGLGACLSEWLPLARCLSENYGVLLYERAGVNKSEAAESARTPQHIAEELYGLLQGIHHESQLLLLAHSQGGLYAQQFCRLYPDMVKGLILLDPLSAEDHLFRDRLSKKEYQQSGVDKTASFRMMLTLARCHLSFLSRALLKQAPPFYYYSQFDKEETADILGCTTYPEHARTALSEYTEAHIQANIEALKTGAGFPDIPLILITHDSELAIRENMEFGHNSHEFAEKIEEMWQSIMKKYLDFSSQSSFQTASHSTHYIHLIEPELIIKSVKEINMSKK